MSFLAPSLLWGLFFATIPILIHLISTRRTQKIDFSSIRFIKELEHDTIRKLKLRQLLLLLMRTIAIFMLILSFARPVKVGYFPLAETLGKSTRVALLFDNSASMSAEVDGSTLLERSKESAMTLLNSLEGEIILDIYQTTPFRRLSSEKTNTTARLKELLQLIRHSSGPDRLLIAIDSAIARSDQEERLSGLVANRELYLFSDFPPKSSESWRVSSENIWRLYLFLQPPIVNNLRVKSAGVSSLLKMPNQLLTIETIIANNGRDMKEDIPVQLFLDNSRAGQVVSNFQPSDEKDFAFQAFAGSSGIIHGFVEIPEDEFRYDNRSFFQFSMTEKIRCLLLRHNSIDGSILNIALKALNQSTQIIELNEQEFGTVGSTLLSNNDVVFFLQPSELTLKESDALEEFLMDGGSAVVFLGDTLEGNTYEWLEEFEIGSFNGINRLSGEKFFTVEKIRIKHPLFFEFPATNLQNEMPQIFSHVSINGWERSRELLLLSNGEPFLLEKDFGPGRIILFTMLPDLAWTDLPVRGIFVPLLHRILVYLMSEVAVDLEVEVGNVLTLPIPREDLSKEIVVKSPNGIETKIIPNYVEESMIVEHIESVGIYTVFLGGELFTSFVANLPVMEDPSNRMKKDQIADRFRTQATRIVTPEEDPVVAVNEARKGTELWYFFLIGAFMILVAETWIGRVRKE